MIKFLLLYTYALYLLSTCIYCSQYTHSYKIILFRPVYFFRLSRSTTVRFLFHPTSTTFHRFFNKIIKINNINVIQYIIYVHRTHIMYAGINSFPFRLFGAYIIYYSSRVFAVSYSIRKTNDINYNFSLSYFGACCVSIV